MYPEYFHSLLGSSTRVDFHRHAALDQHLEALLLLCYEDLGRLAAIGLGLFQKIQA